MVKRLSLVEKMKSAFRFSEAEQAPLQIESAGIQAKRKYQPVGSSGTDIYAGYFTEEYLQALRGTEAAKVWDKMRRSDGKVKMNLSAVKNPLRSATWEVLPANDSDQAKLQAEFVSHVLFNDMAKTWQQTLTEILTMIDFGYSVFEETHKVVFGHKKFGSYNGLQSLGFRAQKTIETWELDPNTGALAGVKQWVTGDLERRVLIPGEFLVVFTMDKEGDNFEGVSMLRPCYGPWLRKQTNQKLNAIGIEKFAVPTPVLKVPANKFDTKEYDNAVAALEAYTSHQSNYITLPVGWEIDFAKSDFDPAKVQTSIDAENKEITFAFLANFLELGMSGGGGSYALGNDLSDFFLGGIEYIAQNICETLNRKTIKRLVDMKFGPQEEYPKLQASGIADKAGKEFSEILNALAQSKYLTPDDPLEEHLRKRLGLPKKSDQGVRSVGAPVSPMMNSGAPAQIPQLSERPIQLAEKKTALKQLRAAKEEIKALMQVSLKAMGDDLISQLTAKAKKLPPSKALEAIKQVSPKGSLEYKAALKDALARVAQQALEQARREVPKVKSLRFAELGGASMTLSEFDKLPPQIKKRVQAQTDLLTDSQLADMQKAVLFQYSSSVGSTESAAIVAKDLTESLAKYVEGASVSAGAGNVVGFVVNDARMYFFNQPEVQDEIEAYEFINNDPQSEICKDLAGTVFAKDDPESARFMPPLHHNCESYIAPVLKGDKAKIDPTGLKPSSSDLEKFVTLHEGKGCC